MASDLANPYIYAIAGPTASGKTALGVKLAERVGGEVVNFDSVQIYREIEIATAKPTRAEMREIPHHLIDYVDPRINYTAADWARDAIAKLSEIEARRRVPVLVGGTGFYFRTLLNPLFDSPKTDEDLRRRMAVAAGRRAAARPTWAESAALFFAALREAVSAAQATGPA